MSLGSSLDPATVVAVTTAGSFVAAGGAYLAASRRPAPPTWAERHARGEDWTDGCIAVTNEEIERIFRHVRLGTRVVIVP